MTKRIANLFVMMAVSAGLMACGESRLETSKPLEASSTAVNRGVAGSGFTAAATSHSRECYVGHGTGAQELVNGKYGSCLVHTCDAGRILVNNSCLAVGSAFKIVDARKRGDLYGYGASVIYTGGLYHTYFCSSGTSATDWDHISHATSADMLHWSDPETVLTSSNWENSNCDPSVVLFDRGDGPYYYLFYGGYINTISGSIFVARSRSPGGPFLKYTYSGEWQQAPQNANPSYPIVLPIVWTADTAVYGAGMPEVVVKDGAAYMWYNDTSATGSWRLYLRTSYDLLNWSQPVDMSVDTPFADVKYDSLTKNFLLYTIELPGGQWTQTQLEVRTSVDGVHWSAPSVVDGAARFPDNAVNPGISGNAYGHIIHGQPTLVTYGAPYDLNPAWRVDCATAVSPDLCWGRWDIYASLIEEDAILAQPGRFVSFASAESNEALSGLPASNVIDNSAATVYSSKGFLTNVNDRGVFLTAHFAQAEDISTLVLVGRDGGQGFPKIYRVYVTNEANTAWEYVSDYSTQPDVNGNAALNLGAHRTWGVLVVPQSLGADAYGNHYFQLSGLLAQ